MIANFALMGDIYQYDPYETEASLWNSYPWQIGLENNLDISAALPKANMSKMIWEFDEVDSPIGAVSAVLGDFGMFSVLVLLDNFGNMGDDVGGTPPKPDDPDLKFIESKAGAVLSVTFKSFIVQEDSNSETPDEAFIESKTGSVNSVNFKLKIKQANSNSETPDEAFIESKTGSVSSVTFTEVLP